MVFEVSIKRLIYYAFSHLFFLKDINCKYSFTRIIHQRQQKTSDHSLLEITSKAIHTKKVTSTESLAALWLRVVTSQMAMALVESQSMGLNSQMKTLSADITREGFCPWLTQAQTLMDHSFSLLSDPLNGKLHYWLTNRLDDHHVVFGELIEGDSVLRQMELVGSRSGTPGAKIVIEDCGEIKKEDAATK